MKLREYKKEDYPEIKNLLKLSWDSAYKFIPREDRINYLNTYYTAERFQEFQSNENVVNLIAEENNIVAGWMRLEYFPDSEEFHLSSIYLLPEFKGRGIGTVMINKAFEIAKKKGHKEIWVGVMKENVPALRWYEKLGFTFIREEPFQMGATSVPHLIGYKEL